jgi:type IV secretory pathway TrbD component
MTPAAIAAATGLLPWWIVAAATGRREPWDASLYWVVAYPLARHAARGSPRIRLESGEH